MAVIMIGLNLEHMVARYLETSRVQHVAATTLRTRRYCLGWFIDWCNERDIQHPQAVDRAVLEAYQRWLFHYRQKNGHPLKVRTQLERLSVVRGLFRWLQEQGVIAHNPASHLQLPRHTKRLPSSIFNLQEVEQVIEQPNLATPVGLRDRAMMEVLFSTGIRRQELIGLRIMDVDLEGETLWIHMGKGNKQRRIPIGSRALIWLEHYMQRGRIYLFKGSSDPGWIFLNSTGGPLAKDTVTKRFRSYIAQAGIGKTGSCHIFRHTMATLMLEGGADIRYIQDMLGHTCLNTTQIYTRVSPRHLKDVHNRTHPGAKLTKTG